MATYQQTMFNPSSAKWAIEEHQGLNPPGQAFRKQFIDWGGWRKRFGVRKSIKEIEPEELMDEADYVKLQKEKSVASPLARKKWKVLTNDPKTETEGEGAAMMAWVPLNKRRNRERDKFEEGAHEEGSKKQKNPKLDNAENLKKFAVQSESQWNSGLLSKKASSAASSAADAMVDVPQDKQEVVNIFAACPKQHAKHEKALKPLRGFA